METFQYHTNEIRSIKDQVCCCLRFCMRVSDGVARLRGEKSLFCRGYQPASSSTLNYLSFSLPIFETRDSSIVLDNTKLVKLLTLRDEPFFVCHCQYNVLLK